MVSWMKGMHIRSESNIRFHRRSQGQLPFLRRAVRMEGGKALQD